MQVTDTLLDTQIGSRNKCFRSFQLFQNFLHDKDWQKNTEKDLNPKPVWSKRSLGLTHPLILCLKTITVKVYLRDTNMVKVADTLYRSGFMLFSVI